MTPARGDHEARRRDVSAAVWRVLATRGFGALTLRAVAAEMNASTGLLTHYFPNKQALLRTALEVLDQRNQERPRRATPTEGLAALRAVLLDVLPLTAEGADANRIWVSSWDVALADPELATEHAERYRRSRTKLTRHVEAAQARGELPTATPAADLAAAAQSFTLGLVVQALFAPTEFPPERQIKLLDDWLAAAGAAAGTGTEAPATPPAERSPGAAVNSRSATPEPAAAPPAGSD
ncbi:TetR/AcrR family transcriptional regulator [Kitasatospora kifunensis]|uniref:AcrR family transcriptional regulator n=1 Tax=Kitasatospora kifunensis TaxID=58351 RepID=A0A7W7R3T3_KITKI|nr:TetR family transcriptional regulator C-terminal domain-containing protein [Kitasatospora kifunensis]MBB4924846.1 AcrR family transcriptional regulator [Kitasatospora kifunensis]